MSRMMDEILKVHEEIQAAKDKRDTVEVLNLLDDAMIRAEEDATEAIDQLIRDTRADDALDTKYDRIGGIIAAARVMDLDITEVHYLHSDGSLVQGAPTYEWKVGIWNPSTEFETRIGLRVTLIPETKETYWETSIELPHETSTTDSGFSSIEEMADWAEVCLQTGVDFLIEDAAMRGLPLSEAEWEDNQAIVRKAKRDLEQIVNNHG